MTAPRDHVARSRDHSIEPRDDSSTAGGDLAVRVEGLTKHYGQAAAVRDLSLAAARGQVTALLGPNGAGKTTTLECLEGLRQPDSGIVRVLGLDPARQRDRVGARIGVMLQEGSGGYPGARAGEMLTHLSRMFVDPVPVDELVERLGLGRFLGRPVRRLSGGERQRLALAMAVVGRPELVVLDEPTAGLDPQSRLAAWDLITELRADGVAVLLSTHHMDEAQRLSDVVVIIDHGKVLLAETPDRLVGQGKSQISFTGPPRLPLVELRQALPHEVQTEEPAPGFYVVSGAVDPATLATLTAWCASHGVTVHDLHMGPRSLEDVFISLTGRGLRT